MRKWTVLRLPQVPDLAELLIGEDPKVSLHPGLVHSSPQTLTTDALATPLYKLTMCCAPLRLAVYWKPRPWHSDPAILNHALPALPPQLPDPGQEKNSCNHTGPGIRLVSPVAPLLAVLVLSVPKCDLKQITPLVAVAGSGGAQRRAGQRVDEKFLGQRRRQGSTLPAEALVCKDTEKGRGSGMFQEFCKVLHDGARVCDPTCWETKPWRLNCLRRT
ncbi:hypothetical protein TREES_T100000392 [Tupaia chinensis]|uniref:Uncharacterized protein n=1 Tax=Tupaia chinensis TaxID=246437 RepID=L9KVS1_TUPCH|nr:hypothetical protein TREES_T100000392 [Tupaia chinensis]